jgi:hypothetical protein
MATDAQGRQLSDDGYYYWDGANWQPVTESGAGTTSSEQYTATDAQGRQLSEDGNYYWDGANWQLVSASGGNGAGADTGQTITADDIITGAHALTTVAELAEIFGQLPETLGVWVEPIDGVILIVDMVFNVIKALETQERGAGYRGTAYGTVYGALGMGVPSATCSGSDSGAEQDQLNQKAFDEGASEAYGKMSDTVSRNRVLVRIAHDGDPGTTVTNIYQHLCSESDDHALAMAYSSLPWPGPVCA